ncbi:Peroxisome biogenesis protein 16 [Phytophthora cinnamomi]|uniref:Peroxisome biogenesis protein 16 n=1 Tax=Phytophthora cinnamomi TaxID=4785 RepID=UPI003559DCFC|nr:Peroxisome biogenesis protein 16 [Phytophthora cinnamomi]
MKIVASLVVLVAVVSLVNGLTTEGGHPTGAITDLSNLRSEYDGSSSESGSDDTNRGHTRRDLAEGTEYDESSSESGSDDTNRGHTRRDLAEGTEYNGSSSESGSDDTNRGHTRRGLAEGTEYDGSSSESGSDDTGRHTRRGLAEDSDVNAYCRPGAIDWPACRAIGYPGCKPGMVRWPQCRNDATTRR